MALTTVIVHIASGQSLSPGVQLPGTIVGIELPASWVPALLGFQASADNITYDVVYDQLGNELSKFVVGPGFMGMKPNDIPASLWMKLQSGTSGTPVIQTSFSGVDVILTVQI